MIGPPVTDVELDEIELAAEALIHAVAAQDYDSAFIIASTCEEPAMLAMFVAEIR